MSNTQDTQKTDPIAAKVGAIGQLVTIFGQLVEIVRTKFLSVVMTLILIAATAFGYATYRNIDSWFLYVFPKHDFQTNLTADSQVQTALGSLREFTKADRVFVMQWHNGVKGDGVLPFRAYSVQYAETAPGVSFKIDEFRAVPLSIMSEFNVSMWPKGKDPVCIRVDLNDIKSNILKTRWEERGTDLTYFCPVVAIDGTPVGALGISYLERDKQRPSDEGILGMMEKDALRISGYLQSAKIKS